MSKKKKPNKKKKKKNQGPGSLTDTGNKTHQTKPKKKGLGNAWKLPG